MEKGTELSLPFGIKTQRERCREETVVAKKLQNRT